MGQSNTSQGRFENVTSEHVLLALFMVVSGAMVVRATISFPRSSAVFPQFVGTMTFIGSALLLVREYLPDPINAIVTGSTELAGGGQSEEIQEQKEKEREEEQTVEETSVAEERPLSPALFTAILIVAYIGLSYLFSMVLMTPLFVVAYLLWFKKPWYAIVGVTALATVLAWAFATVLITPVDEGIFVDAFLYLTVPGVP